MHEKFNLPQAWKPPAFFNGGSKRWACFAKHWHLFCKLEKILFRTFTFSFCAYVMHEFPYSSAPKFKKFQISHCISFRSDFCSLPLSTTLTLLLYPFCIEKKRPHHTYRITSPILNWQLCMSGLLCLVLNCAKSRYSRLTWQPDSPHCWDVSLWVLKGQTGWH